MNVLFVSAYNPYQVGSGPGNTLHYLSQSLAAIGCKVHILCPKLPMTNPSDEKISIHFYDTPLRKTPLSRSYPLFSLFSSGQISQIINAYHIELINGESPSTFAYPVIRHEKLPLVVTVHGTSFGELSSLYRTSTRLSSLSTLYETAIIQPAWACLTNMEYHCASNLVAVSAAVANELAGYYRLNREKIKVIHNGVFVPETSSEVNQEEYLIFSVGRMTWRKGFLFLIQAMTEILKEYPRAKLVLLGRGSYKESLIEYSRKLGLSESVIFKENLSKQELSKLYAMAHVYVQPSLYEPFAGTVLEAMAAQKPIVACRVGGIPEMISDGKNGVLVEPYSSHQLANAIKLLLSDSSYANQLAKNAKQTVLDSFTWETIAKETLSHYEKVLNASQTTN
jgi:Glycosyltransferase